MARHSIFKTRKPRQYNYNPRFYDPDEEELNARVASARGDVQDDSPEAIKARIRAGLNGGRYSINRKFKRDATRQSNKRVFVIALIVTIVIAFLIVQNAEAILSLMQ